MVTITRKPPVKLKNPKKHTSSSQRWLVRQLNDPYVLEAQKKGYRSRAAFKLLEIDEKYNIFRPGMRVLDLGCAPGGWAQVALERIQNKKIKGTLVGIDLLEMLPLEGAVFLQGDFLDLEQQEQVLLALGGKADVVLSDMAASSTGHAATDHLKIMALLEEALECAKVVLESNGSFVAKVLQGGSEHTLLTTLKRHFTKVVHFKPKSSRKESAEMYVIALGFKGEVQGELS